MTLKNKAFAGIRWNIFSTIFLGIGGIVQLMVLVKYVEKGDFGLMAMVNTVLSFAYTFQDFGFNSGIIHKQDVTHQQLSSLFWINIFGDFGLALLVFFSSGLVSIFFKSPDLIPLIQVLAFLLILNGVAQFYRTLHLKDLRFQTLSIISIISFIVSFIFLFILAFKGYGVYALAYGMLFRGLIDLFLCLGTGMKFFIPSLKVDFKNLNFFFRFGSFQMGERIVSYFIKQADVLLIGKFLGADILGVYDVLKRLLMRPVTMINPALTSVMFPVLSSLQENEEKLSKAFLKLFNYICSINFPIYLFFFFHSEMVLLFLFDSLWLAHEGVFKIIALYFMLYSAGNPIGTLLLATGRADMGFYWNLMVLFILPLSIYFSLYWGLTGVVLVLFFLQILLSIPNYLLQVKAIVPIPFLTYYKNLFIPLSLSLLTGFLSLVFNFDNSGNLIIKLAITGIFGVVIYSTLSWFFNRSFIQDIKELANL